MTVAPMSSHDKVCAAIAILQDHILAADSVLCAEKMFSMGRLQTASLELAERLLSEALDDVPFPELTAET